MRLFSIGMLLIAMSTSAVADNVCYERIHDAAHMQKHKLQEVTKIRLDVQKSGDSLSGQISAAFRELPDYLSSDVMCTAKQKTTSCQVDYNGGSFDFVPTAKGIKLTNTSQIRFGGINDGVVIGGEAEHRVFALVKTACNN